jgi:hypothetical protein
LLERIKFESFWLGSPAFADVLVRREALQGLQPPSVVVGVDEVGNLPLGKAAYRGGIRRILPGGLFNEGLPVPVNAARSHGRADFLLNLLRRVGDVLTFFRIVDNALLSQH